MPDYRHKTRGFVLREDAYVRRCEQGEFARDEFEAIVEPEPVAQLAVQPVVAPTPPVATVPSTEKPTTELDDDDNDAESGIFGSRSPSPRKRRR